MTNSFIDKAKCRNCKSLIFKDGETYCKERIKGKGVGGDWVEYEETKLDDTCSLFEESLTKEEHTSTFCSLDILDKIKEELNKDHLEDDNLKLTAFLVAVSGLLKEPKKRMSMAFTGDSSVGKDNLMKTELKHMPEDNLFLTGATQPAIEDEAVYVKILALSEMNLFKEGGANKNLLEVVKQRTEGGTSSLKKDVTTGFQTTKHEQTEQGTTFYGTTDAERNAETETRFIFGHVGADERKIRVVNQDTAKKHSNPDSLIQQDEGDSWIKKGLSIIIEKYGDCFILIPYAPLLIEKDIIDNQNPRSMRDFKRLLALTSARTFISAEARECQDYKGHKFLISSPQDFLDVVRVSQEFFNQTYSGMDERLNKVLQIIDSNVGDWIARDYIQRLAKVSLNTIRSWTNTLETMGLVEWKKGADLNYQENVKTYDGNKIYFKRCQKGIKIPLIRCEYSELKEVLKDFQLIPFTQERYQNKGMNSVEKGYDSTKNPQIDTFGLIPLDINSKEDLKGG